MKINGAEIIELTIGEHDDTTHSLILDAMHKSAREGILDMQVYPAQKV